MLQWNRDTHKHICILQKLYNKVLTCHESGGYYKTNDYTISYETGTAEGESTGPPRPRRPPLVMPRRRWSVPVPLCPPFLNRPPRETLSIEERKPSLQVPQPECGRAAVVETPNQNPNPHTNHEGRRPKRCISKP